MNGTLMSIVPLVADIKRGISSMNFVEVAVCPPYVYLAKVSELLSGTSVMLGGQNVSQEVAGAFTGEISCEMLTDFECHYVIIGHSERRTLYGETNEIVAEKFSQAQASGLVPVLCVGELREDREAGHTEAVIEQQLRAILDKTGAEVFKNAVIAYEPVWAIGTGLTATPDQAQNVHAFIRGLIAGYEAGDDVAEEVRIIYGGSVKPDNAQELFRMNDIDGGLIGGAALNSEDFLEICRAADSGLE